MKETRPKNYFKVLEKCQLPYSQEETFTERAQSYELNKSFL